MSDLDIFKGEYLPNLNAAKTARYANWRTSNPGEAQKWDDYCSALIAGQNPAPPSLATYYGKMLVAAGKMAASELAPPPPPPPPPPSGTKLTWAPVFSNPITVPIANSGLAAPSLPNQNPYQPWIVVMEQGKDYILKLDHRHETTQEQAGLSLSGGRNVAIISGEIEIPGTNPGSDSQRDAFTFVDQTGVVHVEGVHVYGKPNRMFCMRAPATFQFQNCRGDGIFMWNEDNASAHSDIMLEQSPPIEVRLDMFTSDYDNTGLAFYSQTGVRKVKRTNIRNSPTFAGGIPFITRSARFRMELDQVWSETGYGRATNGPWPALGPTHQPLWTALEWQGVGGEALEKHGDGISPGSYMLFTNPSGDNVYPMSGSGYARIDYGVPPDGDFVPVGVAGRGYQSPGYL